MKILLLGAKGLLGRALVKEFQNGNEVLAYDRNDLDVTNKNKIKIEIEKTRPSLVINATAYNAVDKIEENVEDFKLAEMINGYAVGFLAEICKNLHIPLVHYSTEYIFKGDNQSGYPEDSFSDPINKYGGSKALGEKLLKMSTDKFYLIRLSRLFGPAGESAVAKKSFVDTMLDLVDKGQTEFNLVVEEKSCPTYSVDLARLTRYLVENHFPFGIYHGANAGACTWYELAQEIFKIKNLEVKCNPVSESRFPRPARRPAFAELINTKLPPQRRWQEALAEYLSTV